MTSFFQKKYIKIPIVVLIIFSISFRFFPPLKRAEASPPSSSGSFSWSGAKVLYAGDIDVDEVLAAGFNTAIAYVNQTLLDEALEKGLWIIPSVHSYFVAGGGKDIQGAVNFVNTWKYHPAIAAWYFLDEPELNGNTKSQQQVWYNALKAADPARDLLTTFTTNPVQGGVDYFNPNAFDHVAVDLYPFNTECFDYSPGGWQGNLRGYMDYALNRWNSLTGGIGGMAVVQTFYDIPNDLLNPTGHIGEMLRIFQEHGIGTQKDGYAMYAWTDGYGPTSIGISEDLSLLNEVTAVNKSYDWPHPPPSGVAPPIPPSPAPSPPPAPPTEPAPSPIDYLDLCEPKVPFYDEALQTDELQEACYLLKKIQDRAAQMVTVARGMYELTDLRDECNPWWEGEFPNIDITKGNCKSVCAWGLPELFVEIDITLLILCIFFPEVCAGKVAEIKKIIDLINKVLAWEWIWSLLRLYDIYQAFKTVFVDFTNLIEDAQTLIEKINELFALFPDIDLSDLEDFYETLAELMLIKIKIQQELTNVEGKIAQMKPAVGVFNDGQLMGIYRLINEIGDIFANNILSPGQSLGDGFVAETLKEMEEAAGHLTCGSLCDDIEALVDAIIAENDAVQQILFQFYEESREEVVSAIVGMLDVICQTKPRILTILSYLVQLEEKIKQAPSSAALDDIEDGVDAIKPVFEELSDKIAQLESGEIQEIPSCVGRADGTSCGDFRWCLDDKCYEYYWKIVGKKSGWCCGGDKDQCNPDHYEEEKEGGGSKDFYAPENEYGGIKRYDDCDIPFCMTTTVGEYECNRKEVVQEEEPWPPEEVCRMRDHFYLLQKLEAIITLIRGISQRVERVTIDLESSNEQIVEDSREIREALDEVKIKIEEIRGKLIEFGVSAEDINEAKAELDEIKPMIDELEEKSLEAMGVINFLKALRLIKDIIDLIGEIKGEYQELCDSINKAVMGEDGGIVEEIETILREFITKLEQIEEWQKVQVSVDIGDLRDAIRCLPAKGKYGKYTAESYEEIPCPVIAWWRETTCTSTESCSEDRVCKWGFCRKACDTDADCDEGYLCDGGACYEWRGSKYVGGRVCSDLKVPSQQLMGALASIQFNLNKIRDIKRDGHPEVEPVETKGFQLWERALYLKAMASALKYTTDNCRCGRSYCRLVWGVSGISFPGALDPLLNPYCWLGLGPIRNWVGDEADKLENENSK